MIDDTDSVRIGVSAALINDTAGSQQSIVDQLGRFAELVSLRAGTDTTEVEELALCGLVLDCSRDSYELAVVLRHTLPWLPVEESGQLRDKIVREDFLDAVFALARWHDFVSDGFDLDGLVEFHNRSKFQLLAHNPALYRDLDRLVARAGRLAPDAVRDSYRRKFMAAMRSRASRRRHVSVLQHMAGFVKRRVSLASRRELNQTIREYQRGTLPRSVPLVLLRHHAREQGVDYLAGQTYFTPFPLRLLLA
jgi:uncharacterized protein YbgA (DUF1722 family)